MAEFGEQLSDRELEVLRCLARGAGNKEIAGELFISENTVKVHLRNVFTKLGVSTRTEAAAVALQQGVIVIPGMDTAVPLPEEPPISSPATDGDNVTAVETAVAETLVQPESPPPPVAQERRWLNWRTVVVAVAVLLLVVLAGVVASRPQTAVTSTDGTPSAFEPTDIGENWKAIRPLPEPRANMAAAASGLNVYVIGGETAVGVDNSLLVYHTTDHTWEYAAAKPTAVSDITAAELFGEIYVVGGRTADGKPTDIVEVYSPANNSWRAVASLPQPIAGGLALSDGSQLYLIGGWDGLDYLDTTYVYDLTLNSWRPLPPMTQPRAYLTGGFIKGLFYAVGGYDGQTELAVCEQFDPVIESWTACPDMLSARARAGAAAVVNNLYVVGGENKGEPVTFSEVYEPKEGTWSIVNTPVLAAGEGNWRGLGVTNVETRIFALGGQRLGDQRVDGQRAETLLAESYFYSPLVFQTFIPAASSGGE